MAENAAMTYAQPRAAFSRLLQTLKGRTPPLLRDIVKGWQEDRLGGLGAEMAFFAVLSLVPATLAMAAGLGSVDRILGTEFARRAERSIVEFLELILTEQASSTIEAVRELFTPGHGGLFSLALLGALLAFTRGLVGAIRALEVVYGVPAPKAWLKTRGKAVVLALGTILVFAFLLSIVVVGPIFGDGAGRPRSRGLPESVNDLWTWLRYPLALGLVFAWAAALLHYGPNHRTPWSWDLPGALLAGGLWLTASIGFRLYLEVAVQFNQIFGALGGALTLMIWFYVLSLSLLIGGEFNMALDRRRGRRRRRAHQR
jgi:membrane protein